MGQTYEKGPKTVKAYPRPDHTHENLLATVPFIYGIGPAGADPGKILSVAENFSIYGRGFIWMGVVI